MKLTPGAAAARAGVSPQLIYQWCRERRLTHYRLGTQGRRGRILIEDADLDALLQTLKVTSQPPGDDGQFRHPRRRPAASPS
jgi:excisionase family DNA binding protein